MMVKAVKIYIPFFIIISLAAGIFYGAHNAAGKDSDVAYDQNETYPEGMRPRVPSEEDEMEDESLTEEDLLSDENFKDFEIEEEKETVEEAPEETKEEPETPQAEQPTDAQTTGDEVEILPEKVNAREQPNSGAKIVTVFEQGQRGVLVEEGESWSIIKIGDSQGYVSNHFWKRL